MADKKGRCFFMRTIFFFILLSSSSFLLFRVHLTAAVEEAGRQGLKTALVDEAGEVFSK